MIKKHFRVITNNPLVKEELSNKEDICYFEATYEDILLEVRACIYDGYKLLSHPLSGSCPLKKPTVQSAPYRRPYDHRYR